MSSIVNSLLDAAKASQSVQSIIVGEIVGCQEQSSLDCEETAHVIANIVGEFKHEGEAWVVDAPESNDDTVKSRRKKINNIINDISRICREKIGYSIVNTVRAKGQWSYSPAVPKARVTTATAPTTVSTCGLPHFDETKHIDLFILISLTPLEIIDWLIEQGYALDDLGRAIADRLRTSKGAA